MRTSVHPPEVPYITTAQMIEVDRAMIEDLGIDLLQMMENAGRCLAHLARSRFLGGDPRGANVTVLAGTGGNGGGALAAARRLHNYGAGVRLLTTKPDAAFTSAAAQQLAILRRMGITPTEPRSAGNRPTADVVLDGLIGYSLSGAPRGMAATLIRWANEQDAPVLALDVPSGIDAATGAIRSPAIRAAATLTLALPKEGLRAPGLEAFVGELYVADISVPPEIYAEPSLGLRVGHVFAHDDIVRLH